MAEAHAHAKRTTIISSIRALGRSSARSGRFVLAVGALHVLHVEEGRRPATLVRAPGPLLVIFTMFGWWRDVIKEAHEGYETPVVQLHLRYGMILFIASEVMFFVAWFWAYFDAALFPDDAVTYARTQVLGGQWPPIPSADTGVAGARQLQAHLRSLGSALRQHADPADLGHDRHLGAPFAAPERPQGASSGACVCTVVLGVLFTAFQAYEYMHAGFGFANHIYGSTFFMATGFHGFHVIVGTIFLTVCLVRAMRGDFTPKQHFGFEAAAWYWHFVDVVWLFLFTCIYVWGAGGNYPAH